MASRSAYVGHGVRGGRGDHALGRATRRLPAVAAIAVVHGAELIGETLPAAVSQREARKPVGPTEVRNRARLRS